jgi:hypothetical protein
MLFDQNMQSIAARNPADQASVLTQRNDWVSSDTQIFLARLTIYLKQCVYQTKQLHHTFILSYIFVTFQKKKILTAIRAID